jgi:hypothetical protein
VYSLPSSSFSLRFPFRNRKPARHFGVALAVSGLGKREELSHGEVARMRRCHMREPRSFRSGVTEVAEAGVGIREFASSNSEDRRAQFQIVANWPQSVGATESSMDLKAGVEPSLPAHVDGRDHEEIASCRFPSLLRVFEMDLRGGSSRGSAARKRKTIARVGCSRWRLVLAPETPGTALSHNRVRPRSAGRTGNRAKHRRNRLIPSAGVTGENSPLYTNQPAKMKTDRVPVKYILASTPPAER